MKVIKYKIISGHILRDAKVSCADSDLEANLEAVKMEAYGGQYTVEEDGADIPTQLDIIEAQVSYTAMMTDTLLEV